MTDSALAVVGIVAMVFFMFVFAAMWASCYSKVAPNQVLIVSGRRIRLPDGNVAGFRIVKGGGTLVLPVIERADVLSLEVISLEMPALKVRAASGKALQMDCIAQVKIRGDDVGLVSAIEHFLSKTPDEIKAIVRPILETHLSVVAGALSAEEIIQNPAACAARVENAVPESLGKMGLSVISFAIRNPRPA